MKELQHLQKFSKVKDLKKPLKMKEGTMTLKSLHHICIQTNTYEASLEFYTKVLEFEVVQETKNFHGRDYNTWLQLGSFLIEMQTPKVGETLNAFDSNAQGMVHFCLHTDEFNKEYQRIKALGTNQFMRKKGEDIYTVENGQLFKMQAPEGTIVEIRDNAGI